MIIYVKYAKNYFPSNYVTERSDKPLAGFEALEIESLESFLSSQDTLIKDFMATQIQPPEIIEENQE